MADGLRPVDEDAPVEIFSDDSMGAWEERDVLKDRKESDESHTSILHDSSEGSGAILEQTKSQQREHEPNPLRKFRDRCGDLVNNERVQLAIILLIVINAAMMGIATFDFIEDDDNSSKAFETTDTTFLIIFTIELGLQFVYRGLGLFTDAWLVFDFIIVLLSWSLEGLQIVRAFRIFRAFRLVTRLEILRNLVLALFRVAPSLTAIVALLVLILYIFAVLCTQLFQDAFVDGITDRDYFGSLDKTLFTLFEMMTLEWADVVRQIEKEYYWARILFTIFLCITSFILYSLIIAVVCDAVAVTEHQEDDAADEEQEVAALDKIAELQVRLHDLTQCQRLTLESVRRALDGDVVVVDTLLGHLPRKPKHIRGQVVNGSIRLESRESSDSLDR